MFQTKGVDKIKTCILCSITFFKNSTIYEIMWKNIVELDRPQMTVWHMCIACWIPKTANTHSEYVVLTAFPLQQWLHERASMLRYTYIASLVNLQRRQKYLAATARCLVTTPTEPSRPTALNECFSTFQLF